jgi:hypothetical protein
VLKRVLFGLLKGALVGGLLGAAVVFGLGMPVFAAWVAYVAAVLAGALTGLVAGRAIWEKDARIEAGLKAGVGALIGVAAMFAIRKWLNLSLDLGALGKGAVGQLPLASLPLIATVLALFYELDNTGDAGPEPPAKKTRVEGDGAKAPAALEDLESALDAQAEEEAEQKATKH